MGDSQQSADAAYQAALVTRDRAAQGRQDAIDILQRLLEQMGDDPLLVQTRTNLMKILENPEVITDEVFNNIMSKSAEILDANYDQQVQTFLGEARSRGIAGPALQIGLQQATQARAVGMAAAYRDAIIKRAETGIKTNMDAIAASSTLLQQLFQTKGVLTDKLAETLKSTVEEPAKWFGVDAVTPGIVNRGGGSRTTMSLSNADAEFRTPQNTFVNPPRVLEDPNQDAFAVGAPAANSNAEEIAWYKSRGLPVPQNLLGGGTVPEQETPAPSDAEGTFGKLTMPPIKEQVQTEPWLTPSRKVTPTVESRFTLPPSVLSGPVGLPSVKAQPDLPWAAGPIAAGTAAVQTTGSQLSDLYAKLAPVPAPVTTAGLSYVPSAVSANRVAQSTYAQKLAALRAQQDSAAAAAARVALAKRNAAFAAQNRANQVNWNTVRDTGRTPIRQPDVVQEDGTTQTRWYK